VSAGMEPMGWLLAAAGTQTGRQEQWDCCNSQQPQMTPLLSLQACAEGHMSTFNDTDIRCLISFADYSGCWTVVAAPLTFKVYP
jgi:hypothetical protein